MLRDARVERLFLAVAPGNAPLVLAQPLQPEHRVGRRRAAGWLRRRVSGRRRRLHPRDAVAERGERSLSVVAQVVQDGEGNLLGEARRAIGAREDGLGLFQVVEHLGLRHLGLVDELVLARLARHGLVASDAAHVARRRDLVVRPLHGLLVRVLAPDEDLRLTRGRLSLKVCLVVSV